MADAVGRFPGKPGVCLATAGPGATNLLTGIGGAFRDSSPVLGMTLAELETLSRLGGPVAVIVMNHSGYGNVRQAQELGYGRTAGADFSPIDFAAAARACGLDGTRVTDRPGLIEAVGRGLAGGGPFLSTRPPLWPAG